VHPITGLNFSSWTLAVSAKILEKKVKRVLGDRAS